MATLYAPDEDTARRIGRAVREVERYPRNAPPRSRRSVERPLRPAYGYKHGVQPSAFNAAAAVAVQFGLTTSAAKNITSRTAGWSITLPGVYLIHANLTLFNSSAANALVSLQIRLNGGASSAAIVYAESPDANTYVTLSIQHMARFTASQYFDFYAQAHETSNWTAYAGGASINRIDR